MFTFNTLEIFTVKRFERNNTFLLLKFISFNVPNNYLEIHKPLGV